MIATITMAASTALRQVVQQGRQEERDQDRQHGGDDAGHLRPRSAADVDRALREAAGGRQGLASAHRPWRRRRWRAAPGRCRSAAPTRCRLVRATSTVSRKAITAIARAPGSRSKMSPDDRQLRRGQTGRHLVDQRQPVLLDVGERHQQDAARDDDQRSGHLRQRSGAARAGRASTTTDTSDRLRVGCRASLVERVADLREEATRVRVGRHAQQRRQLAGRHRQPDTDPDTGQRRGADVLDQRAEPEQRACRAGRDRPGTSG